METIKESQTFLRFRKNWARAKLIFIFGASCLFIVHHLLKHQVLEKSQKQSWHGTDHNVQESKYTAVEYSELNFHKLF